MAKSKKSKIEEQDMDQVKAENEVKDEVINETEDTATENSEVKEEAVTGQSVEDKKEDTDYKDKYLRLSAEFDNYRKRTLKEKMDLTKTAGEQLLKDILPVVDNFERALKSLESAKDIEAVKEGINLIYGKFSEFLTQKGLKEIEAMNLEFDTDLHEALTKIPAPTEELKGKVIDVIQKGYFLHDKVVRYAKVVIGE